MSRCYTVNLTVAAIANATTDLCELGAADDIPIGIRAIRWGQTSDVGDAQDEVLELQLVRGNTVSGSGGSAATPVRKKPKDSAATFTAEVGNTTAANTGTTEIPYKTWVNVRAAFEITFTEDEMVCTDQGSGLLVLRLPNAPADSLTMGISIDVWEMV
jgi:hypothetical protein